MPLHHDEDEERLARVDQMIRENESHCAERHSDRLARHQRQNIGVRLKPDRRKTALSYVSTEERRNPPRCPDCGGRSIVMRFGRPERISYHCLTHGPFAVDEEGTLRA